MHRFIKPSFSPAGVVLFIILLNPLFIRAQLVRPWRYTEHSVRLEGPASPHIKWAEPWYSGPVRALIVTDLRTSRWVVELQQRLETEYDYAYTHGNNLIIEQDSIFTRGGGRRQPEDEELKRYLKYFRYEVAVIQNPGIFLNIPQEIRDSLLERVREGMGLVILGSKGSFSISDFTGVPAPADLVSTAGAVSKVTGTPERTLTAGIMGKGRVVIYGGSPLDYEVLPEILIWAAQRESPVKLDGIRCLPEPGEAGKTFEVSFNLFNSSGNRMTLSGTLIVRNGLKEMTDEKIFPVVIGPGEKKTFRISSAVRITAGDYSAGLVFRDDRGQIVEYGIGAYRVESNSFIKDGVFGKENVLPSDTLTGSIVTSHRGPDRNATLNIILKDTWNRTTYEKILGIQLEEGDMKFDIPPVTVETLSRMVSLEISLEMDNAVVDSKRFDFPVVFKSEVEDLVVDGYLLRACDKTFCDALRKVGIETGGVYAHLEKFFSELARNNFRVVANFGAIPPGTGPPGAIREGIPKDWPDAEENDRYNIRMWQGTISCPQAGHFGWNEKFYTSARVRNAARYSPLSYDMADEFTLQHDLYNRDKPWDDLCFCSATLKAFREYLVSVYGTLEALNAQWETGFGKWEEVVPLTMRKARLKKNAGPWLDFRIFLARDVVRALAAGQRQLDSLSNGARGSANIHWEGPYSAFMAYYLFGPGGLKAADVYPRTFDQVRSHCINPAFRRIAIGYTAWGETKENFDYWTWKNLFYGGGRITLYNALELLYESSVVTPTYAPGRLWDWAKQIDETMKKPGIAKAILTSRPAETRIAILDSYPSRFLHYLEPQHYDENGWLLPQYHLMSLYGSSTAAWKRYAVLCDGLGLTWKLVTDEEIESGKLDGYRAVILPEVTAVSAAVLDRLNDFASKGGLVMADRRFAERDSHGRFRDADKKLSELFGVRRAEDTWENTSRKCRIRIPGRSLEEVEIESGGRDTLLEVTDGLAMGSYDDGIPAVVIKRTGKGYGLYLNIVPEKEKILPTLLEQFSVLAGFSSPLKITDAGGRPLLTGFLRLVRKRGVIEYVSLLKEIVSDACGEKKILLSFPSKRYTYDMGTGRFFGLTDRIEVPADTGRGHFFARLPYKVRGIDAQVRDTVKQGERLSYKISLSGSKQCGDHVVRLEFIDPSGSVVPYWTGNVLTENGLYTGSLAVALNEKPGTWSLHARDAVSGKEVVKNFNVKERN